MTDPAWMDKLTAAWHRIGAVKGEPKITVRARNSAQSPGGNGAPTRVVIHATAPGVGWPKASRAGMAASTARYFAGPAAGGSAHYTVDVEGEQHSVPENTIAYHAPPNAQSIGIEICAEATYTREQWLSPEVWPAVLRAAARTADLCARYRIPVRRIGPAALKTGERGICGHVDISQAFKQSTHTDPGPAFPWAEFIAVCEGKPGDAIKVADLLAPKPPAGQPSSANSLPTLTFGNSSKAVEAVQAFCNAYPWKPALPLLRLDGRYGPATAAVILGAQRQMGIVDSDGRDFGPRTKAGFWLRGFRG